MTVKVKKFLYGLLYEQNEPSLTRVILAAAFISFILGTVADIVLQIWGVNWNNYSTFASITGGGAVAGKVGDRIVNTITTQKYGSAGQIPPRIVKNPETGEDNTQ